MYLIPGTGNIMSVHFSWDVPVPLRPLIFIRDVSVDMMVFGFAEIVTNFKHFCRQVIRKARSSFISGKTLPISFRLEQLRALVNLVKENRGDLLNALHRDLRKPRTEGIVYELDKVESEATSMIRNLEDYASPEKMPVNILTPMDRGYIRKEPYGVVLIVGTWNFPFLVCLSPLVGAIAAGNVVIIKPSEVAPFSANILAHLIPQYLDRDCFHVVLGDVAETEELLQYKFDYIFFTGSPTVGKKILAAAAPHLTPVTLELGGKNPCYIDESVDIEKATKRIIWGKFLNAGQACISIDYIVCTPSVCEKFLRLAYQLLNEWHGTSPRSCASLSRIVNGAHFKRLSNLLDTTHGRIILGGNSNERELWIQPTVVIDVEPGDVLLQEEIFGPILPIVTVNCVDDAIELMRTKPTSLALYTFSTDNSINDKIIRSVPSGGVCINDVILHTNWNLLPFGGCGTAGMGSIHGKFTFDTFTHHRSVLHRGLSYFSEKSLDMRYPPFTAQKTKLQSLFVKHFDKFFVAQSKLYKFLVILAVLTFYLGVRRVVNIPKLRAVLNAVKMTIVRKLR